MSWLDLKLSFSMADSRAEIWALLVLAIALSPLLFFLPETTRAYWEPSAIFCLAYGTYAALLIHYYSKFPSPKLPHAILMGFLGLNFGLALGWLVLIVGIALHTGYFWLWVSIGLAFCAFAYGTYLAFKRWRTVFLAAASLYLLAGLLVTGLAAYQKHVVDSYAKLWKSKGWPMEAREIFPKPSTRSECSAWLNAMGLIKKEPLLDYYYRLNLNFGDVIQCFQTGEQKLQEFRAESVEHNFPWEYVEDRMYFYTQTMESCPYLQKFDAYEIEKKQWHDYHTSTFAVCNWARLFLLRSLMSTSEGRISDAESDLDIILNAADLIYKGEGTSIDRLSGGFMEKLAIIGYASILASDQRPFPEEVISMINARADGDLSWLIRVLDEERLSQRHFYDRPYLDPVMIFFYYPHPWLLKLPYYKPMFQVFYLRDTLEQLNLHTSWSEWTRTLPDLEKGKFPLAECYKRWPEGSLLKVLMGRSMTVSAQWRLLFALDGVVEYHQAHAKLPERLDELSRPIPLDLFDDKPLKYIKETENRFAVYSIGPDLKDGSAKDLFVLGELDFKKAQDVGFRITLGTHCSP